MVRCGINELKHVYYNQLPRQTPLVIYYYQTNRMFQYKGLLLSQLRERPADNVLIGVSSTIISVEIGLMLELSRDSGNCFLLVHTDFIFLDRETAVAE